MCQPMPLWQMGLHRLRSLTGCGMGMNLKGSKWVAPDLVLRREQCALSQTVHSGSLWLQARPSQALSTAPTVTNRFHCIGRLPALKAGRR